VNEHRWVCGAISTKTEDGEIVAYFVPFACMICGTTLSIKRSKAMTPFMPLPEELQNGQVDADCDLSQVRQVMES